jgi:drug/metabolite transporter (DMT)-like permease
MLDLIIASTLSASISLLFKLSGILKLEKNQITTSNYFFASLISVFLIGSYSQDEHFFKMTLSLGVFIGVLYFVGFVLYQFNIENYGIASTNMFSRMGIIVPVIFSMIFWKQVPSFFQSVGITMAIMTIFYLNMDIGMKFSFKKFLVFQFFIGGIADFGSKIFEVYLPYENKGLFMSIIFISAFFISSINTYQNVKKIDLKSLVFGIFIGIPNLFTTFFIIRALKSLQAPVVYSGFAIMALFLATIGGAIFFKEGLNKKIYLAMFLTVVSVIFINL